MNLNAQDAEMDALLAERYRCALAACSDANGQVQFDWLVMHLWLAMTDAVQAAFSCANACRLAGGNGDEVLDDRIARMRASVLRVLPSVLPLMGNFAEPDAFLPWREGGGAHRAASSPGFLSRARNVGLPLSETDLLYAMGPDGPAGKAVFLAVSARVRAAVHA